MSEQQHEPAQAAGRTVERDRQQRALERASRQESWIEQLQRIHEQTKGWPESRRR